jgi:hypothetical protein
VTDPECQGGTDTRRQPECRGVKRRFVPGALPSLA